MRPILLGLLAIAALAGACAQEGGGTQPQWTEAQICTQGGGVWRPALGVCDRSAGGGGGGY